MPLSWLYPKLAEVELAPGEIMSLYNGSPCATGFVTDAALTSARRFRLMLRVFALAVEAVGAPLDAYDPALQDITADPDHRNVLRQLNACLDDVPKSGRLPHQAPVSWRIVPAVLATVMRAVRMAQEDGGAITPVDCAQSGVPATRPCLSKRSCDFAWWFSQPSGQSRHRYAECRRRGHLRPRDEANLPAARRRTIRTSEASGAR